MKIAILSDIHANLHAFKAVLKEIAEQEIEAVACLGDVVGYGAQPAECVDALQVLECPVVMGNHDFYTSMDTPGMRAVLEDPDTFGNPVWDGVRYAREQLSESQLEWLRERPPVIQLQGMVLGHAALHDFENWPYLLSYRNAKPTLKLLDGRLGIFGHTHQENVFPQKGGEKVERRSERRVWIPEDKSVAITVGSVGQPRGGDLRAHWLIWDPEERVIEFQRTDYDAEAAAHAILRAGLPEESALRLLLR